MLYVLITATLLFFIISGGSITEVSEMETRIICPTSLSVAASCYDLDQILAHCLYAQSPCMQLLAVTCNTPGNKSVYILSPERTH